LFPILCHWLIGYDSYEQPLLPMFTNLIKDDTNRPTVTVWFRNNSAALVWSLNCTSVQFRLIIQTYQTPFCYPTTVFLPLGLCRKIPFTLKVVIRCVFWDRCKISDYRRVTILNDENNGHFSKNFWRWPLYKLDLNSKKCWKLPKHIDSK